MKNFQKEFAYHIWRFRGVSGCKSMLIMSGVQGLFAVHKYVW